MDNKRCKFIMENGDRCKNYPEMGSEYCFSHRDKRKPSLLHRIKEHPLRTIIVTVIGIVGTAVTIYQCSKGPTKENQEKTIESNIRQEEKINRAIEELAIHSSLLENNYPNGYFLFGAKGLNIRFPGKERFDDDLDVDTRTAKILKITDTHVEIQLPDFTIRNYGILFSGNTTRLSRSMKHPILCNLIMDYEICTEIVTDFGDWMIIVIGFKKIGNP